MFFEKMQTRKNDGFTLVELIVVIAILAILAGIAVPAYSGYIEKANVAADEQLLHAVNIAFASAAAEHAGGTVNTADLSYGGSAGAVTVTGVSTVNGAANEKVATAFATYYGENTSAAFKTVTRLMYDSGKHMFVNPATAGTVTLTYNGNQITVSGESVQKIIDSTYGDIGAETLLSQVAAVSNLAAFGITAGNALADVVTDEYLDALAKTLKMKDVNELDAYLYELYGDDEDKMNQFYANSLVLSAAGATAGMDSETAINKLKNDPNAYISQIKTDLANADTAEAALSDAALIYGVYTSYVYATDPDNAADKIAKVNSSQGLINALTEMQSAKFDTYMKEGSGEEDLTAYLEAMKVINSAASDPVAKQDILEKGFSDEELLSLMQSVMG